MGLDRTDDKTCGAWQDFGMKTNTFAPSRLICASFVQGGGLLCLMARGRGPDGGRGGESFYGIGGAGRLIGTRAAGW